MTLFSVLPPKATTGTDTDAQMAGYLVALDGVGFMALKRTSMAIIQGEIEDLSTKVCPTPPELSRAVRRRMREDRALELASTNATKLEVPRPVAQHSISGYTTMLNLEFQAWNNGSAPGPLMLAVWDKHGSGPAPHRYDGRAYLAEAPTAKAAEKMAKRGTVPPGSLYVARFGAFYGPPQDIEEHRQGDRGTPLSDELQS